MTRIGRYEVVRELRAGGMGSVTLCNSPGGELVVLKRPHSVDAEAAVRLRDEARIGARLLHPAIVDTLDLFEVEGGVPVLVVAYVDGPSLEVLRPLGPLPMGVIARVGRQIAEGLFALHETCDEHGHPLHILHRDVTPGNIVVGRDGDAKLIDLGIARFSERQAEHTQDGFLRGTMRYLAPELLQGDTYSAASDLWALGMVLWEAAVGRFAYRGETDREVLAGILRGEPMELEAGEHVDERLVEVIRPLLHPSPALRLSSGAALAARFAELEAVHGDTEALTRATIAEALVKKGEHDAAQKARLAQQLEDLVFPAASGAAVGEAAFFADEETDSEAEPYAPPPPLNEDPFGALPPTEALPLDDAPSSRGFEHGEKTVSVPAPVSFLVAPPLPPSLTAPLEELPSKEEALEETTSLPTIPLPPEALRSDEGEPEAKKNRPPSIDDLPAARPKARSAPDIREESLPSLEPIDPEDPDELLPLLEPLPLAQADGPDDEEPGAHLLELPEPAAPVAPPSATFASLFQEPRPAAEAREPPHEERTAGEVMKLNDVVALLDDEG